MKKSMLISPMPHQLNDSRKPWEPSPRPSLERGGGGANSFFSSKCPKESRGCPMPMPMPMLRMLPMLLVAAMTVLASAQAFADFLYLNEGEEHVGSLNRVDPTTVYFNEVDGKAVSWPASEVSHITISKVRPGDQYSNVASLTDPLLVSILKHLPEASEFPDADYVTLYNNRNFAFQADGSVLYEKREILRIFKEPGLDMANRGRYYQIDREKFELVFAHTYAPDGRIFHLTDDAVSDESIYSSTPEYDKQRKSKFAMKKVDLGSVIDIAIRFKTIPPTALYPYLIDTVFGEREPVLRSEFAVSFPEKANMIVEKLHWNGANLPTAKEEVDPVTKVKTLSWTFREPKGFIPEQNMPSTSRVFPRILVFPASDWKTIGKEFEGALEKAAPLPALLDSFLKEIGIVESDSASTKVRKVHDAILKKIRLLPISCYDMSGVVPISTDVALQKRYGSNLARVCLMYFALKKLGIASQVGFVNYWGADEFIPQVPNMGQASYGLLKIELDGVSVYTALDNDYLPFGHLSVSFQGARAVFLKGGEFVLETLPEGGSEFNITQTSIFARLEEDGSMEVTEIRRPRGPGESGLRTLRATKEQEKQNFAEKMVKRIHPKAVMLGFAFSDLDDLQAPVALTLRYKIPDAAIQASDQLLAFKNLWVHYNSSSASLASRTWPLEYWATEETGNSILIEIPAGFKWVPWSKPYEYKCGCMEYSSSLAQKGSILLFADRFKVNRKFYDPVEGYNHYRNCLLVMSDLAKQWIILEKAASGSASIPAPSPAPSASPASSASSASSAEAGGVSMKDGRSAGVAGPATAATSEIAGASETADTDATPAMAETKTLSPTASGSSATPVTEPDQAPTAASASTSTSTSTSASTSVSTSASTSATEPFQP
ncbi:hypothetical protein AUK22_02865 [bacterium CG2_30_54_10]|nr:MAG: hypothetical protein AUK22_02865 [bacterium CG2_30_54_10]